MTVTVDYALEVVSNMLSTLYIYAFLFVVILDLATGYSKAAITKNPNADRPNSKRGVSGLLKHTLVVIVVLVTYLFMQALNFGAFATAFVLFYIANYALSIVENFDEMGVPFPPGVREVLEKLRLITGRDTKIHIKEDDK